MGKKGIEVKTSVHPPPDASDSCYPLKSVSSQIASLVTICGCITFSIIMADEGVQERATKLAAQALELVAAGRNEVSATLPEAPRCD